MSRRRRAAITAGLLAGLALAAVATAFVAGATVDVTRWRELAARQAAAALGRPVEVDGALRLTLGRELKLQVGGLRVLNPPGFSAEPLLAVAETKLVLDALDLLRGAAHLRRIEAGDVTLSLEHAADGRANWAPSTPRDPGAPGAAGADIHIGHWRLQRVAVRHLDARTAARREFEFDSVAGGMSSSGAVHVDLQGLLASRPAYRLRLEGGPLRLLQGGSEPWPFTLDLKSNGASFDATGAFDARRGETRFDFSASVDDPARAGRALGWALPPLGRVALRGSAAARADGVELSRLQGSWPGADVAGNLALAFDGPRPRLTGALRLGELDLRPTLETLASARHTMAETAGPAWQAVALPSRLPFDAELDVGVGRWSGLPLELREIKLKLQADARGLRVPIDASWSGAAFNGQIELDSASGTPTLAGRFSASAVPAGELVREIGGVQGIEGTLKSLAVRAAGRGETLGAWIQDLDAAVEMVGLDVTYGAGPPGRLARLRLDSVNLMAPRGERLRGRASGVLLGEPVAASMLGGRLPEMLQAGRLPFELSLATAPATLRISTDLADWQGDPDPALGFDFQARRAGELARWLAVDAASTLPVALNGRLRRTDAAWVLDPTMVRLGRSELSVSASHPRPDGNDLPSSVGVRAMLLDVPELSTLRTSAAPAARQTTGASTLPIELGKLDLTLDLQKLVLGRSELHDVGVVARFRQGRLLPSPISGRVAGTRFDGIAEADWRDGPPRARVELSTGRVDVGLLLHELGAAESIVEGQADSLRFTLQGQGRDTREFARSAEVQAGLVGGNIVVRGALQHPLAEIRLREAAIGIAPGQALRVRLDGTLDQTPVRLELSTGTLPALLQDRARLPFSLQARGAGTLLALDGEVALPLGRDADLRLQMSGDRLDSLNRLSRVELPAWGPWAVAGPIRLTPAGYELPRLALSVGQSRLDGTARLDLSGPRPHLALQVSAPSIQLDDFPPPERLSDPPLLPSAQADTLRGAAGTLAGRTDRLLSAGFLRRYDADVELQVGELLSGADRLADAALRLKLRDGRLDLDPVLVNVPGGRLRLSASYDLKGAELDFALAATIERFDYGIIARRLRRGSDVQGLFSLQVQIQGRAPSLETLLHHAEGQLDIAVWPKELNSGVFNLWSVNLVLNLLPLIDPGSATTVNCVVGRFDLKNGILRDDVMIIDTTAVRIRGTGQANLRTEALNFVFRPRAKGFALFRLQNPLRVTGTLFDQRIGLDRRDLPESVLRLIASPILWPIERFTLGPLPRDGADICADPLRALAP